MEVALWFALTLGLVAMGAGVTYLIGMTVPEPVFERAQRHGRYAGLCAEPAYRRGGGTRIRRPLILPAAHPAPRLQPVRA